MTENKYLADGPLVVAIDSSTTSTKAIVVDAEGNIWHTAKQNIQLHTPAMDQYEHNPIRWWETSRATIGEVLSKLSPTDRSRIAAIGITHQRESFAPFDKDGRPLRNGILWLDGRATEQIRRYGSEHIHELSGKPAGVTPAIYKMAWVKEHEPEIFADAYKVMDVHGYVAWMLTGPPRELASHRDTHGLPSRIRVGVDRSLNVVEQQVRDLHLHDLHIRHIVQQQRVIGRGLQGQRSTSEQAIVQVLDHLDIRDARERKIMSDSLENARARDDPLRRHRVCCRQPFQPRNDEQRNRNDHKDDPNRRQRPLPRVHRHKHRSNNRGSKQQHNRHDPPQQHFDVRVHVANNDFIFAQELLRQTHGLILPDRTPSF